MANEHVKGCSASLGIREARTKPEWDSLAWHRVGQNQTDDITNVGEDAEKQARRAGGGAAVNGMAIVGKLVATWPRKSALRRTPKRSKNISSQTCISMFIVELFIIAPKSNHPNVHQHDAWMNTWSTRTMHYHSAVKSTNTSEPWKHRAEERSQTGRSHAVWLRSNEVTRTGKSRDGKPISGGQELGVGGWRATTDGDLSFITWGNGKFWN